MKFYKKYSTGAGYGRLNRNVKRPYVKAMKELCDELGMRFYVSERISRSCALTVLVADCLRLGTIREDNGRKL